jgi:hypothetical protein
LNRVLFENTVSTVAKNQEVIDALNANLTSMQKVLQQQVKAATGRVVDSGGSFGG